MRIKSWQDALELYPPRCSQCKAPVDRFIVKADLILFRLDMTADCHGESISKSIPIFSFNEDPELVLRGFFEET